MVLKAETSRGIFKGELSLTSPYTTFLVLVLMPFHGVCWLLSRFYGFVRISYQIVP